MSEGDHQTINKIIVSLVLFNQSEETSYSIYSHGDCRRYFNFTIIDLAFTKVKSSDRFKAKTRGKDNLTISSNC